MKIRSAILRKKIKNAVFIIVILGIIQFFGIHIHFFEKDFDNEFDYPLFENIFSYVEQLKNNDKPSVEPINVYNYSFLSACEQKCKTNSDIRLVLIIKSALHNFQRRIVIRNTWGYENRFSDVTIKTVFVLGVNNEPKSTLRQAIEAESKKHQDIVQADFFDAYFNNTIKTMMGFTWAMKYCPKAKYYMFSDDDMYISIKNVLRFIRNPSHYPEYVEEQLLALAKAYLSRKKPMIIQKPLQHGGSLSESQVIERNKTLRKKRQVEINFELPDDAILYTGFVFNSSPHRHMSSKWYVSLQEYPWHKWPPYVSAGAYILSQEALVSMYYASHFTKHFRFDDIYVGILAKKMAIEPFHCKEFYFYKKDYDVNNYRFVIASHGYANSAELLKVWNEQRSAGNA